MTRPEVRSVVELVGSILVMIFAVAIAVLSTIAIIALVFANLLVVTGLFGFSDFPTRTGAMGLADWLTVAWFPAALLVAIRNCVDSLALFTNPNLTSAAKLAAWSLAILLTFPPLWGVVL